MIYWVKDFLIYADFTANHMTLLKYIGKDEVVEVPQVDTIGEYAFYQNTNIKNIYIPNMVKRIAKSAFKDCTNLQSVMLDNEVLLNF